MAACEPGGFRSSDPIRRKQPMPSVVAMRFVGGDSERLQDSLQMCSEKLDCAGQCQLLSGQWPAFAFLLAGMAAVVVLPKLVGDLVRHQPGCEPGQTHTNCKRPADTG